MNRARKPPTLSLETQAAIAKVADEKRQREDLDSLENLRGSVEQIRDLKVLLTDRQNRPGTNSHRGLVTKLNRERSLYNFLLRELGIHSRKP